MPGMDGTQFIRHLAKRSYGGGVVLITGEDQRCLLYTSDAADERSSVDLGGRRIIKKNSTRRQRAMEDQIHRKVKKNRDMNAQTKTH